MVDNKIFTTCALLRIAREKGAIVDNVHAGGLVTTIGIDSGEIISEAADESNANGSFSVHPVSKN